jgi:glycine cleavage system H protein
MADFLETTIDKFTFRVDPSCLYSPDGIWIRFEEGKARLGLSDFLQQRSGDIAFVEVKPEGTSLTPGSEFASIETVKVNVSLESPISGEVVKVNPAMKTAPERINQDPFGEGWLCEVEVVDRESGRDRLLSADAYFQKMVREATEAGKS